MCNSQHEEGRGIVPGSPAIPLLTYHSGPSNMLPCPPKLPQSLTQSHLPGEFTGPLNAQLLSVPFTKPWVPSRPQQGDTLLPRARAARVGPDAPAPSGVFCHLSPLQKEIKGTVLEKLMVRF